MILEANRYSESPSVKVRLKEKKYFNLWLDWTGTVSEVLIFLNIIDTIYGIDSMKTAIMKNDLMKSGLPKVHSKKLKKGVWTKSVWDHSTKLLFNEYCVKFNASMPCEIDWNFLRDCFSLRGHKHLHSC